MFLCRLVQVLTSGRVYNTGFAGTYNTSQSRSCAPSSTHNPRFEHTSTSRISFHGHNHLQLRMCADSPCSESHVICHVTACCMPTSLPGMGHWFFCTPIRSRVPEAYILEPHGVNVSDMLVGLIQIGKVLKLI
jgi:hypothetical protein